MPIHDLCWVLVRTYVMILWEFYRAGSAPSGNQAQMLNYKIKFLVSVVCEICQMPVPMRQFAADLQKNQHRVYSGQYA